MELTEKALAYGISKCRKCERLLPLDRFRQWDAGTKRHRSVTCLSCEHGKDSTPYATNESGINRAPSYTKNKRFIERAKSVPCHDCKCTFPPVCMDFDHVRGAKLYNVSQLGNHRPEVIEAELAKCEVVCACCHRLRTQRRKYVGTGRPKASNGQS